jgi:hypothetical protein
MSCRASLAVLLLGILVALSPVAHGCPTDPTWIPGLYDDNDYDDVIFFITGAVSAVDSGVVDPVGPIVVCLGRIAPSTPRSIPGRPLESVSTRAPPQLLS